MQNTFIGYHLATARKYHKKRRYFLQNTFIGYTLGTTRKYHKYIDCKSICEKYNNQKSFRGLSLRLAAIE